MVELVFDFFNVLVDLVKYQVPMLHYAPPIVSRKFCLYTLNVQDIYRAALETPLRITFSLLFFFTSPEALSFTFTDELITIVAANMLLHF